MAASKNSDDCSLAWLEGKDHMDAFIDAGMHVRGAPGGPLTGLTVAIKDMYDIAGQK
jgi:Asp-tRNA(Asn)/Glu-tRNA(Gln) amidotransferase A subunit family amidase